MRCGPVISHRAILYTQRRAKEDQIVAQAFFYCMDYRVLDNMTLRRSVELTFPAGFEADVSDHASLEPSAAFSPVIWNG